MSPRFAPGDQVRARVANPAGHTRVPRYVRGHTGVVEVIRGDFPLPDAIVAGAADVRPQTVYAVRFNVTDLWGPDAEPGSEIAMDLWEDYLEPVSESDPAPVDTGPGAEQEGAVE